MNIDQIINSYRKLSVDDKRKENIDNLKLLITVFETEWIQTRNLVLNKIKNIINNL